MNGTATSSGHLINEIERYSWGILLLLSLLSLFLLSPRSTIGILIGGLICIFNFRWLRHFTRRIIFCGDPYRAKALARVNYLLRYLAVAVIIYSALKAGLVYPPATFLGLSVIVMGITVVGVKRALTDANRRRN
jgi:hypothetical protein